MDKTAKTVRVITAPPIAAALLFSVIYTVKPDILSGKLHFFLSLIFFAVLPLLSYPVCEILPFLKSGGRKTQRKAAIVFSVLGYVSATVFFAVFGGSKTEWLICLTYLFSGVLIGLCSVFGFKPSGHTSGISGPVAALCFSLGKIWGLCFLILIPVFWASLKTKRHTVLQLIIGTLIPIAVMIILKLFIQ